MDSRGAAEFEAVFARTLPRALRVAVRILGDENRAEDAAAEAFARAHASWGRVGKLDYCDAWILRVTSNVAIDMVRKEQRAGLADQAWSRHRRVAHSGADVADVAASRTTVIGALATLPRRQRQVLSLSYLEDLTEAEIARCLSISVGTVKKTTSKAKEALRRLLGEDWERSPPEPSTV